MTNKHESGVRVARRLISTEHALDAALAEAMRLGAEMVEARTEARFGVAVGQDALETLIQSLGALGSARAALAATHSGLLDVADEHRVSWRMDGYSESKPKAALSEGLKVVA